LAHIKKGNAVGDAEEGLSYQIFYSDEDRGYIADVPDRKPCSAFGETPEEALGQVLVAQSAWLEAPRATGKVTPEQQSRPVIYRVA
jgi:predicted RNase H-like HicB family nuclease